jgi:hypothetical protein
MSCLSDLLVRPHGSFLSHHRIESGLIVVPSCCVLRTHRRALGVRGHGAGLFMTSPHASGRGVGGVKSGFDDSGRSSVGGSTTVAEALSIRLIETASSATEVEQATGKKENRSSTDGNSSDGACAKTTTTVILVVVIVVVVRGRSSFGRYSIGWFCEVGLAGPWITGSELVVNVVGLFNPLIESLVLALFLCQ